MFLSTYELEHGRHVARLHHRRRRRRRRRRAYAPTSNTASHDTHEKINSWVSVCSLIWVWGSAWRPSAAGAPLICVASSGKKKNHCKYKTMRFDARWKSKFTRKKVRPTLRRSWISSLIDYARKAIKEVRDRRVINKSSGIIVRILFMIFRGQRSSNPKVSGIRATYCTKT